MSLKVGLKGSVATPKRTVRSAVEELGHNSLYVWTLHSRLSPAV
jgi:hypothetical protein